MILKFSCGLPASNLYLMWVLHSRHNLQAREHMSFISGAHMVAPLEICFIHSGNKEIYCIFKTSVFFFNKQALKFKQMPHSTHLILI